MAGIKVPVVGSVVKLVEVMFDSKIPVPLLFAAKPTESSAAVVLLACNALSKLAAVVVELPLPSVATLTVMFVPLTLSAKA